MIVKCSACTDGDPSNCRRNDEITSMLITCVKAKARIRRQEEPEHEAQMQPRAQPLARPAKPPTPPPAQSFAQTQTQPSPQRPARPKRTRRKKNRFSYDADQTRATGRAMWQPECKSSNPQKKTKKKSCNHGRNSLDGHVKGVLRAKGATNVASVVAQERIKFTSKNVENYSRKERRNWWR